MSSQSGKPSHDIRSEVTMKRRKVRKGTFSCWECKRRKMKCMPDSLTVFPCKSCQRRGSYCVSQEFPEETWSPEHANVHYTLLQHASLRDSARTSPNSGLSSTSSSHSIAQEIRNNGCQGRASTIISGVRSVSDHDIATPTSMISEPSGNLLFYKSSIHRNLENKYEGLSKFLYDSLPSREDMMKFCNVGHQPSVLTLELLTTPYTVLDQNGLKTSEALLDFPEPHAHPVLIARFMLEIAVFLQHLHPDIHKDEFGPSESPRVVMERVADLAIRLVTTNEELVGSIEGLECVMYECIYQGNIGNLRRSWIGSRRAIGIAQLMGLDRANSQAQYKVLDPKTQYDPQLMWFRIVLMDRYLCILLGLPQGSLDRSMASEAFLANDTPLGRLERIHCAIASRILERNQTNSNSHDVASTRILDLELQRAARILPSKWWLVPELVLSSKNSQTLFWEMRRMFAQVLHYNLLNQLHLPHMLRSSHTERKFEYSRMTCVNASREILSRFIILRNFNQIAYSCRTVDFLALMAAMTLLLVHLRGHNDDTENLLAHQYLSDRAMIEKAQENMGEINRLNADALSAQSADLLRRMLALESELNVDGSCSAGRVSVQGADSGIRVADQEVDAVVSVNVPYFGVIKIAREGMTKERTRPNSLAASTMGVVGVSTSGDASNGLVEAAMATPGNARDTYEGFYDSIVQRHEDFPSLAAGGEDWAFQGVDMAFFQSLMGCIGNGEETEEV